MEGLGPRNPGKRVSNCKQVRGSMNSPTVVLIYYRAESFSFTSFEAIFGLALPLDSFIT